MFPQMEELGRFKLEPPKRLAELAAWHWGEVERSRDILL